MQMHEIVKCSGTATAHAVKTGDFFEQTFSAGCKYFVAFENK